MRDLRCISELLNDALMKGYEQESAFGVVAPLVTYNLDWEHYLLVQTWNHFADGKPEWEYSLWHYDGEWTKLRDFPEHRWVEGNPPYVEASILVKEHIAQRKLKG